MPGNGKGGGGNGGATTIRGTKNNDILEGTDFADILQGKGGDDVLIGLGGGDVLDGGDGSDTASYVQSNSGVTADLSVGGSGGAADGDTYISIENLTGSAFDDTLSGDAGDNVIAGLGGDDLLLWSEGTDTLDGGAGYDTADFSLAPGGITFWADPTPDGSPVFDVNQNATYLIDVERVIGTNEADFMVAGAGVRDLVGLGGDDTLTGDAGDNVINGGDGDDVIDGGEGNDLLIGGAGNDFLDGGEGDDTLDGGDGDDLMFGDRGSNDFVGGEGYDTISYAKLDEGILFSLGVVNTIRFEPPTLIISGNDADSVEKVIGTEFADILILYDFQTITDLDGADGDDFLDGNNLDNLLIGGDGDDLLAGLGGADALIGGDGTDTATYAASAAAVQVDLSTGTGLGGDAEGDTLSGVENVIGSAFDDVLTGDAGANTLDGGDGDDLLAGLGGADALIGGDGTDTATYAASAAAVQVDLSTGTGLGGDAEGDTLDGIENLIGSAFDDALTGDAGDNLINGGDGDDVLSGGLGANILDGGDGVDTADYSSAQTGVEVWLEGGFFGPGGENNGVGYSYMDSSINDQLIDIENTVGSAFDDALVGSSGANMLDGGDGADILAGMDGDDALFGGDGDDLIGGMRGDDTLSGGEGADTIFFELHNWVGGDGLGDGTDIVLDFEDGVDLIGFSVGEVFDALTGVSADGDDTLISYGTDGSTIRLIGVDAALIGAEDFAFEIYEPPMFIG